MTETGRRGRKGTRGKPGGRAARGASSTPPPAGASVGDVQPLQPLDVDGVRPVVVGTVLWGIAAAVLAIFFRDDLERSGNGWWLWVCVAGFGLGLLGYTYVRRRREGLASGR